MCIRDRSSLSALPLESTLSATNKFLSQAGDYAMYLSRKTANGSPLTEEERSSFASLREYADRLSVQLDDLACSLQNGSLTIEQLQASDKDASAFAVHADGDDRLRQLEDSFTGYPTLIYDGPFSDHLLEKTPQMTRDKPAITPEQAKAIAARVTDRPLPQLRREDSVLPCYVLHDGKNNSVAITRQGGFLCYLVTAKPEALTARLSYQQAVDKAQQFLQAQGYSSMKDTYYETTDGVMTLNFAYLDPATQTICYTDLIKVEISLQDGSVLGLDARGYLVNHHQRQLPSPQLSPEQAQQMLSPLLTVDSVRPALIPTSGKNEAAVYEFFCTSSTGDRVLCYINTATGAEEQLLLLVQTPNGTLTK